MFKVSPFCTDTFEQLITTLVHCSVNNALIKSTPLFNQSFFQMADVTDLRAVDSFLQNPRCMYFIHTWGDSNVILSTTATAAMLEVTTGWPKK